MTKVENPELDAIIEGGRYRRHRELVAALNGGMTRTQRRQLEGEARRLRAAITQQRATLAILEAAVAKEAATVCGECSSQFYASRSDARFCSSRCRQKAHRRH